MGSLVIVPTPATWNLAELPTKAMFDSRIRDAINFMVAPPMCVLRTNVTQSLANNAWTPVNWQVEDLDTDGGHSTVSNTSRYTSQTAGWYLLVASILFVATNNAWREARFRKNSDNTQCFGWNSVQPFTAGHAVNVLITTHMFLAVGDFVEAMAFQDTGVSLNMSIDGGDPRFEIRWVSR